MAGVALTARPPLDPKLVRAWLTARSVARGLPAPQPDRGGYRVDTGSATEVARWVFPNACDGLRDVARSIDGPHRLIKLCDTPARLRRMLPAGWTIHPPAWFMAAGPAPMSPHALPPGYSLSLCRRGPVTEVRIVSPRGDLAASGHAAETRDAFVYDRIATSPDHRRRGLASAVMAALGAVKSSRDVTELLVATPDGRRLYASRGWRVQSPYSTASIAAP